MALRRILTAAAAAVLLLSTMNLTRAAELPAQQTDNSAGAAASPAPAWAGFYAGLFAGYGWGQSQSTAPYDSNSGYYYNWTGNSYPVNTNGFPGGGILGANWQSGPLVFGFEGEIGYMQLKGSAADPNFEPGTVPITDTITRVESDAYTAVFGRLGIAAGDVLLYGKGGMAFLRAEASTIDPCANAAGCGTTTLTMKGNKALAGWSAGGGIEWLFRPRWSARVEYVHYDFGSMDIAGPSSVAGERYRQSIDPNAHAVRIGLSYRF
ncbi:MAG: outer membrane beta-barrel protein [Methanothrix sp.]|nr:outer membrane beta-barrel protein [Methanothrix sp.]